MARASTLNPCVNFRLACVCLMHLRFDIHGACVYSKSVRLFRDGVRLFRAFARQFQPSVRQPSICAPTRNSNAQSNYEHPLKQKRWHHYYAIHSFLAISASSKVTFLNLTFPPGRSCAIFHKSAETTVPIVV